MPSPASAWGLTPLAMHCWRSRGRSLQQTWSLKVSHAWNLPLPTFPVVLSQACSTATENPLHQLKVMPLDLSDKQ